MSALLAVGELFAIAPLFASDSEASGWLLLSGPVVGGAIYGGLYRYYRNTDKSHQFERTTRIDAKPITGNDAKINEIKRTKKERVPGDNRSDHRERVQRVGIE